MTGGNNTPPPPPPRKQSSLKRKTTSEQAAHDDSSSRRGSPPSPPASRHLVHVCRVRQPRERLRRLAPPLRLHRRLHLHLQPEDGRHPARVVPRPCSHVVSTAAAGGGGAGSECMGCGDGSAKDREERAGEDGGRAGRGPAHPSPPRRSSGPTSPSRTRGRGAATSRAPRPPAAPPRPAAGPGSAR